MFSKCKLGSLTLKETRRLLRSLTFHFLRENVNMTLLTSSKIYKETLPEHFWTKREIMGFLFSQGEDMEWPVHVIFISSIHPTARLSSIWPLLALLFESKSGVENRPFPIWLEVTKVIGHGKSELGDSYEESKPVVTSSRDLDNILLL